MRRATDPALALLLGLALGATAPPRPAPRAPLFISPMGEPFRGGLPAAGLERWFAAADADRDGAIAPAELAGDAARFFASLDQDGDGEIEPVEMNRYEREIAPEIQLAAGRRPLGRGRRADRWSDEEVDRDEDREDGRVLGGGRRIRGGTRDGGSGLQGAGRFGLINIPQPVIDADADLNRGVSLSEFAAAAGRRFLLLDTDKDGRLARPELAALLPNQKMRRSREAGR